MNDAFKNQLDELQKLGYAFYEKLAHGKDPLTYTFAVSENTAGIQVGVKSRFLKKAPGVIVTINFCSDTRKWIHTSDAVVSYRVTANDAWQESSYDGSDFVK